MSDEWIIRDEDQETLEQLKCELVKKIRDSPKGKDPRVVELLNQLETERVASKHYALLEKVIWLLGNGEEGCELYDDEDPCEICVGNDCDNC